MPLSRRQFFRRFVNPGARTVQDRLTRYAAVDSYVRTHLLPYDFAVTDQQCSELYAEVRRTLEIMDDDELFAPEVYRTVDMVADGKLQPWREAYWLQDQHPSSAPDIS